MSTEPTKDKKSQPDRDEAKDIPAAGPHARKELTDNEKTPGSGSLPDPEGQEGDVGPD